MYMLKKWLENEPDVTLACAVISWMVTGQFIRAVTVLVVFCLCAFILATPTAILAGIGNAAKYGIIVRSGDALERLSKIKRVAFDKTGTLTLGKPHVIATVSCDDSYSDEDILRIAASAESKSEHPLGKAIAEQYSGDYGVVSEFKVIAGQGISAVVENKKILAGKEGFIKSQNIDITFDKENTATKSGCDIKDISEWYEKGATVIYLAIDGKIAGYMALSDTLRQDSKDTIERLRHAGITPMLLTGDNKGAALSIASKLGIEDVNADLLPEDKMKIIHKYAGSSEPICMVGDGVNDALALAACDAGIAMGGIGSDIAIESADAVLVSDDIKRLPYLFNLMQQVMRKVRINIIASMVINITAVVLSACGILTPVTGALWHNFGSVFVVINAALLLRIDDKITM